MIQIRFSCHDISVGYLLKNVLCLLTVLIKLGNLEHFNKKICKHKLLLTLVKRLNLGQHQISYLLHNHSDYRLYLVRLDYRLPSRLWPRSPYGVCAVGAQSQSVIAVSSQAARFRGLRFCSDFSVSSCVRVWVCVCVCARRSVISEVFNLWSAGECFGGVKYMSRLAFVPPFWIKSLLIEVWLWLQYFIILLRCSVGFPLVLNYIPHPVITTENKCSHVLI